MRRHRDHAVAQSPDDGAFKYDPPHGGRADSHVTSWIESKANDYLLKALEGVKRMLFAKALRASTTHKYDYLHSYVGDLESVIDVTAIRDSKITLGVNPLGGAGIDYWPRIAERYGPNLTVVNESVDPTFRFMTVDWDGKIRMDPSSPYAMQRPIGLRNKFDIAFASDTDHDRHGTIRFKRSRRTICNRTVGCTVSRMDPRAASAVHGSVVHVRILVDHGRSRSHIPDAPTEAARCPASGLSGNSKMPCAVI